MSVVHAAEIALASSAPPGGGSGTGAIAMQLVFFAAIFAIFYFLLIRPQQKQRRERERLLASIKRGDRVVTTSGLHGTVIGLSEHTVTLRVADQVKLEFDRSSVGRVLGSQADKDA
jgi:preprotein translocase subunit YajC